MAEAVSVEVFQPVWLFHPARPDGILIETQEVYDKVMAQGGWVSSPAVFGVITAPNPDQMALQAATILPPTPVPMAPMTGPAVQVLEEKVADLESEIESLHKLFEGYEHRLVALENPSAGATTPSEAKAPTSQGRK
jgi:hypothetical protein